MTDNNSNTTSSSSFPPSDWVETTLGEVSLSKQYGYTESASVEKIGPKFLRITDIQDDFINWKTVPYCPISDSDYKKYKLEIGDIVIARTGNSTGATAVIKENIDAVFASYLIRFKLDPQKTNYKFIDFLLRSDFWKGFVKSVKGGSAQGGANANNFAEFPISLPPLPEQQAIASVLSAFDDKIELLREQNKTLEEMGQVIFGEWFGKYGVDDELPEGWRVGKVKDIVNIFDSQRIPLSSNQRQEKQGKYPYHGATSIMDYVDEYLFDGIYLLLAEDGSVMDQNGYPVLQYVWDKFWVNNHAHVLQGTNYFSTEMLYLLFKNTKIAGIVNGAVQLKINQTNLMNLEVIIPDQETLKQFDEAIQPIFTKIRDNSEQIQSLARSRDELLPRLMRGDVRVKF